MKTASTAAVAGGAKAAGTAAGVVAASGLPAELGALVLEVVGKCRLWRGERAEVARELCGHFLDGLEAGVSAGALAGTFGETGRAARLITRARRRMRPAWWRAAWAGARGVAVLAGVCVVVYGVLAARFFLVSPRMTRNVMNELNAPVAATAEGDRAWPVYLEAKRRFGVIPDEIRDHDPGRSGEEGWAAMAAWVEGKQEALALVREGARRRVMGCAYRPTIGPDLGKVMQETMPGYVYDMGDEAEAENPMAMGLLLPHLGEVRKLGRWLQADAAVAVARGDGARYVADVTAMLGMAGQAAREPFMICRLVGLAVAEQAWTAVLEDAGRPGLLSDAQLRGLAHEVAGFAGGRVRLDVTAEVLSVEDILQRFYSDDGHGDGHYVGGAEMDRVYMDWGIRRPSGEALRRVLRPVESVVMPSRAAVMEKLRVFAGAAAADDALPAWRHDERAADAAYRAVMEAGPVRILPWIAVLLGNADEGPIASACGTRDVVEARRSAVLVVLALECARRAHGAWPARLEELVPEYLPAVPEDPFDGKPLRYVSAGRERPLLYSVGVDGVDEGGRAPGTLAGRQGVHHPLWLGRFRKRAALTGAQQQNLDASRGDWVLWPALPPVEKGVEPAAVAPGR